RGAPRLALQKLRHEAPSGLVWEPFRVSVAPRGAPADGGYTLLVVGDTDEALAATKTTDDLETKVVTALADGVPKSFNQLAAQVQANRNKLSAIVKTMVQEKTLMQTRQGLSLGGIK